jgi:hypothetical protein
MGPQPIDKLRFKGTHNFYDRQGTRLQDQIDNFGVWAVESDFSVPSEADPRRLAVVGHDGPGERNDHGPLTSRNPSSPNADLQAQRHCIRKNCRVVATSILGRCITNIGWRTCGMKKNAFTIRRRYFLRTGLEPAVTLAHEVAERMIRLSLTGRVWCKAEAAESNCSRRFCLPHQTFQGTRRL